MLTVRTQRLLAFSSTAPNASSPLWTTPDGYTVIVKSVVAQNRTATAADVVLVGSVPGTVMGVVQLTVQPGATAEVAVYVVCNPGDSFYASLPLADLHVWVSGSVLTGSPTLPPATSLRPQLQLEA